MASVQTQFTEKVLMQTQFTASRIHSQPANRHHSATQRQTSDKRIVDKESSSVDKDTALIQQQPGEVPVWDPQTAQWTAVPQVAPQPEPVPIWALSFREVDIASIQQALQRANGLGVLGGDAEKGAEELEENENLLATEATSSSSGNSSSNSSSSSSTGNSSTADAKGSEGNSTSKSGGAKKKKVPKIAFIFLLMDDVGNKKIWDDFFGEADKEKYSIYVHRARPFGLAAPLGEWGAINVPQVSSKHCALTGIEVAVFSEALADTDNEQFILVSHDAVPLKPFNYVWSQLTSQGTSKICYFTHKGWGEQDEMIQKHHQWVILNRRHATTFLGNVLPAIEKVYPLHTQYMDGCSDESAVSASLVLKEAGDQHRQQPIRHDQRSISALLSEIGVEQSCMTWVYWGHDRFKNTPLDLSGFMEMPPGRPPIYFSSDPGIAADYLQHLVTNEGFMFARKFYDDVQVDNGTYRVALADILPWLWQQVDEKTSIARVWSRMDAYGQPP